MKDKRPHNCVKRRNDMKPFCDTASAPELLERSHTDNLVPRGGTRARRPIKATAAQATRTQQCVSEAAHPTTRTSCTAVPPRNGKNERKAKTHTCVDKIRQCSMRLLRTCVSANYMHLAATPCDSDSSALLQVF